MAHRNVEIVIKAMCVLHNYLRTVNDPKYIPTGYSDNINSDGSVQEGFWRAAPILNVNLAASQARHATAEAYEIRSKFVQYFSSQHGSVPWQHNYINRR